MRALQAVGRAGHAVLLAALLAGCASSPALQPVPVTSMRQLEGRWQGTITVGNGPQQLYYLTIHPDGSMVAEWGMNWQWGKATLTGGDPSFEMSGRVTGTIRYYQGPGGPSLALSPAFGGWSAQVSPAR